MTCGSEGGEGMRENEVWIFMGSYGVTHREGNAYWVIRKYKRGNGYSARYVTRDFSGYTLSDPVRKFKTFEELVNFLTREANPRANENMIRYAIKTTNPEFWREELEWLRSRLAVKREVKPMRQITIAEVIS